MNDFFIDARLSEDGRIVVESIAQNATSAVYTADYQLFQGPRNGTDLISLVHDYYHFGFCVAQCPIHDTDQTMLLSFAESLGLGYPFVPPYYKSYHGATIKTSSGVNTIEAAPKEGGKLHLAFASNNEQGLHVDGTVEELGLIKCAMLYCVRPAASGGDSLIFNSVAAFVELCKTRPELAVALLHPRALMRKHSSPGSEAHYGPVFSVQEHMIVNRFAIDNTSYWDEGFKEVPDLKSAFEQLMVLRYQSRYSTSFKLNQNDLLIMANDKISHGRESYIDSETIRRKLYRGLYTKHPVANERSV